MTLRESNRALLGRQMLLARRRLSVPEALKRVVALQAQYAPSPYIARARLTLIRCEGVGCARQSRSSAWRAAGSGS